MSDLCQIVGHDSEQLMYVCQELQCIELQNNKLLCQKCLCQHRGVNYNKLKERAFTNYNQYKSNLEQDIIDNQGLKNKVEQDITEIQTKIMKTFCDLQKNLVEFIDQQSKKIARNKTNAEKLMHDSNPSLDTYIYFAKFSVDKKVHELAKQQITQTIDDLISDLKQKIDYLKPANINEHVIKIEEQSFKIESIFQKKSPFGYCNEHCKLKSSICTNITCLELSDVDYHCERCSKTSHAEHYSNDFLQEYDKLKKEQKNKLNFLANEKQEIKGKAQKVINDLINDLKKQQKESYFKYEDAIKIIRVFFQDFEKDLSYQDNKYVFGDLLFFIIITNETEFQKKLNQQYQNFEEKLKSCRKDNAVQFLEECYKLQEKQDEIFKLKKTIQGLEQVINEKDQLIKNQSPEYLLKVIQNNTDQILKVVKEQFKIVQGITNNNLQEQQRQPSQKGEQKQPLHIQLQGLQQQQKQQNHQEEPQPSPAQKQQRQEQFLNNKQQCNQYQSPQLQQQLNSAQAWPYQPQQYHRYNNQYK